MLLDQRKEIDVRAVLLGLSLLFRQFPSHTTRALAPLSSEILGETLFSACLGASHPPILLAFLPQKLLGPGLATQEPGGGDGEQRRDARTVVFEQDQISAKADECSFNTQLSCFLWLHLLSHFTKCL